MKKRFSWKRHSEIVKGFHEDIIFSSFQPKHMSMEMYRQKLRSSEQHGLPVYTRGLRKAYDEGKDGMFIWEVEGEVVGWSWLKVYENEFFKEGVYGEINEVYVVPKFQRKAVGKTMMIYAHTWFKEKGVNTIRVETAASNKTATILYEKFGFKPYYIALQKELSKEED
jgi:GNAT superfamily N-acetyltransferase